MSLTAETARHQVEVLLKSYWQQRYRSHIDRLTDEDGEPLGDGCSVVQDNTQLPTSVVEATEYYLEHVARQDWGWVTIYQLPLEGELLYVVFVGTDGDDGWLELFDARGHSLGTGRRYIELVAWGEQATIRSQTNSLEFPPELEDASERTLWGKPPG